TVRPGNLRNPAVLLGSRIGADARGDVRQAFHILGKLAVGDDQTFHKWRLIAMERCVGDAAKLVASAEGRRGERHRLTQPVPAAGDGAQDSEGEDEAHHGTRAVTKGRGWSRLPSLADATKLQPIDPVAYRCTVR